jgi:hypothetical protein
MKALATVALGATCLLAGSFAEAATTCGSTFDNRSALQNTYGQARSTFSYKSMLSGGAVVLCGTDETNCWDYREPCGSQFVDVWPGSYQHFHLGFDDPAIDSAACFCDPGDGKGAGFSNVCSPCPDWSTKGRYLMPHQGNVWTQIHVRQNYSCTEGFPADCNVNFTFNTLWVAGTQAVDVWILDSSWHWHIYGPLSPNVNWNWGGVSAREVWVRTTGGGGVPYRLNGYSVTVPG